MRERALQHGLVITGLAALSLVAPAQRGQGPKRPESTASRLDRPGVLHDEGYVGSEACQACHPRNHETWSTSYHRKMTQAATGEAVLAPFEGVTPEFEGRTWRLEREGETFFVTPQGPGSGGTLTPLGPRREVVLTTGSHHYQIYWLAARQGKGMKQFPLVWHRSERSWVPRKSMFLTPPLPEADDETGRWEAVCIRCHTTNGTREHESGGTRVAEFGISCEACHGPGAAHVEWHEDPAHADPDLEVAPQAELVHPARLSKERSSEVCGQCHAIHLPGDAERETWSREGFAFRPGDELQATRALLRGRREDQPTALREFLDRKGATLDEYFWPDGEVRVSGREFNALIESPCYERGPMTCLSCHEMHPGKDDPRSLQDWAADQLQTDKDGPGACLACHAGYAEPERWREHTHHASSSPGSDCLNCHMPYTTYGLTKSIRSHRISSPSVAVELASGRPGACNLCHLDRTLGWTADHLARWYGHERPPLDADRESIATSILYALQGDAGQRALAAWALGWPSARAVSGTGWMPFLLSTLLVDPYDAVRWVAVQTLRLDPRYLDFALDFTQSLEEQENHVRETVLEDWLQGGLQAEPERRQTLLIRPDGSLDEERYRKLLAGRDERQVQLSE